MLELVREIYQIIFLWEHQSKKSQRQYNQEAAQKEMYQIIFLGVSKQNIALSQQSKSHNDNVILKEATYNEIYQIIFFISDKNEQFFYRRKIKYLYNIY